jgi:hypothetical protein
VLLNVPVPVPLLVVLLAVVGFWTVPYATPLAVTMSPPSEVTLPPVIAPIEVFDVIDVVITAGHDAKPPPETLSFKQRTDEAVVL